MNQNLKANDFADLARRYIDVIDTPPQDRVNYLTRIEVPLAKLVAAAHDLPQVEPTTSEPDSQTITPPAGLVALSATLPSTGTFWTQPRWSRHLRLPSEA